MPHLFNYIYLCNALKINLLKDGGNIYKFCKNTNE